MPPCKRPRTSSPPIEDSTDYKLALLTSLHPTSTASILLELLLSCNGSVTAVTALLNPPPPPRKPFLYSTAPPRPPKKGETLHLYAPKHIAALTPMSLYPNFFPANTANDLLRELLTESQSFPPPPAFSLFSRTVASPHTSCFFLRNDTSQEYTYQGGTLPSRPFTPSMEAATAAVETRVNEILRSRPRSTGEMKGSWKVNAALVNCYRGGGESVGWHSDQLTYLGPNAVIASVSLGCKREFRVRKMAGGGVYAVGLEHASLLVMQGGMQEAWKHSIHPAAALDSHPIAGNVRINITYRCYRESLRPEFTPKCECGKATILRPIFDKEKKENEEGRVVGGGKDSEEGKYFWACSQEYVPGGTSCGFFKWGIFDEYGEPPWSKEYTGAKSMENEVREVGEGATNDIPENEPSVGKKCTEKTPEIEREAVSSRFEEEEDFGSFHIEDFIEDEDVANILSDRHE